MSSEWNEGYITDVDYIYGYERELSPLFQRFCMLVKGIWSEPFSSETAHCELGFGQGLSFNIHAATNPGVFYGTDFNPSHALNAQLLSKKSNLNTHILDSSFADFLSHDLPNFDSISLHGIWSWVNEENREHLVDIVGRKLKVGGQLYVSYNSMPGWAAAAPLQKLFKIFDDYDNSGFKSGYKVKNALVFSQKLLDLNPKYLLEAPTLKPRLEEMCQQNSSYLAHEYFNDNWQCFYFTDVVKYLASAKVDFITTAAPADCLDSLNLSAEGLQFISTIQDTIMQEKIKDYFVSRQFRRDIYAKGKQNISFSKRMEKLRKMRFSLIVHPTLISSKLKMPIGEIELKEEIYRPIINCLESNQFLPSSIDDLLSALPDLELLQCIDAIIILVHFRFVSPCHDEDIVTSLKKSSNALNETLLQQAHFENNIGFLASPVIGGGIALNRFEQLFLFAIKKGMRSKSELARYTLELLAKQGEKIIKEGRVIQSYEDSLIALTTDANSFIVNRLDLLKALLVY